MKAKILAPQKSLDNCCTTTNRAGIRPHINTKENSKFYAERAAK